MIFLYLVTLLLLGVYSYSQIDLNLTLLQASWFLNFQHTMIQLGYFNRSLSTAIFILITLLLFGFYIFFLRNFTKVPLITLIIAIVILGIFSYPAFSHDIFNYIFDARIAVFHHANPYTSTALMFPGDDWTRFMQWTHRTYPYGPIFLPLSFGFYFFGFGKFLLTLISVKFFMVMAYLGSSYVVYKMAGKKGLIMFSLNPLVIYEAVITGHLDIIMLFFALYAIYKKNWLSYLISVGIKYATIFNFPGLSISWLVVFAYIGAIAQVFSRELLPHYFLVPLGFAALLPGNKKLFWFGFFLSLTLLLVRYLPFLYTGQWLRL